MKGPPRQASQTSPSQLWALRGGAGPSPQKPGVVPTAAITMATNNKHPRNHSGTGSDEHVTGRLFSPFTVRGVQIGEFAALGEISCRPPTFPFLELEGRGGPLGGWPLPTILCTVSSYRAHSALLHLPLKVTLPHPPPPPLPAVTGDQRTPCHSFPFSSLDSWAEGFAVGQGTGGLGTCSRAQGTDAPGGEAGRGYPIGVHSWAHSEEVSVTH